MADEVAMVGPGPTGLLLAGDLAAAGVPCTVLDLAWLPSRFPFMLITPQYHTERLLERRTPQALAHDRRRRCLADRPK